MNDSILSMLGAEEQVKSPTKREPTSKINDDVLQSMLTADGEDGNFTIENKDREEVPEDSKINIKTGKVKEKLGKYSKDFIKQVMDNPSKFMVETSRGTMTIKDAIIKGWSPKTGEFSDDNIENNTKKELESLNESDRAALEKLMDPRNAGIAAADADSIGLDPESQLIKRPPEAIEAEGQEGQEAPQLSPEQIQAIIGGEA